MFVSYMTKYAYFLLFCHVLYDKIYQHEKYVVYYMILCRILYVAKLINMFPFIRKRINVYHLPRFITFLVFNKACCR